VELAFYLSDGFLVGVRVDPVGGQGIARDGDQDERDDAGQEDDQDRKKQAPDDERDEPRRSQRASPQPL